jgi:predicted ribonuclease YlaK
LNNEQLDLFYSNKYQIDLLVNQYLLIKDENGDYIDKYIWNGKKLEKLKYKAIENNFIGKIKPYNIKQECYFDLLDDNIPVKVVSGKAGSGKSFLSTAWALQEIQNNKFKKLIIVRNNVNVQDVPDIGAVPGDINDKLKAYCAFVSDIVSDYTYDMLLQQNKLEIAYLGTMRGRSLQDAIVLCSESQNLTTSHVKMLISRIAKNSVIIFDFDLDQIDKKTFEKDNGMQNMIESLNGHKLFGMVEFDKIERSEVAALADLIH